MFWFSEMNASEMLVNMSGTLDEFYPQIAIVTLMKIIRDPLLHQHHTMAVHAITFLFKNMGVSAVPYLQQVMPSFINVIKTAEPPFIEVCCFFFLPVFFYLFSILTLFYCI